MACRLVLSCVALALSVGFANAQITKGSTLLGGQVYYSNTNVTYTFQSEQQNRSENYNISVGRAFKDNNVFGINIAYSPASASNYYNGNGLVDARLDSYSFGVFFRQYNKIAKDFYFFTEFGAAYTTDKEIIDDTAGTNVENIKQYGVKLALTPGISYKIYKNFHLEILIPNIVETQYTVIKDATRQQNTNQKQFVFNTSLNTSGLNFLGVGFKFIF